MREIKFRAWNPEVKTMNEPSRNMLIESYDGSALWKFGYENLDPMSVILMQFTGLKDKKGKEIYEGDIVEHHNQGDGRKYVGQIEISPTHGTLVAGRPIWPEKAEIIGNVWENADLLK